MSCANMVSRSSVCSRASCAALSRPRLSCIAATRRVAAARICAKSLRSYSADSRLVFEVAEEPKPGQVCVLLDFGGNTELLHLAESITAAELWIAREGYRNARLEIVSDEDGERAGGVDLAA